MNQELKEKLHYYLPHGLKVQDLDTDKTGKLVGITQSEWQVEYKIILNLQEDELVPHMRPLSSLTKEIVVSNYNDGKPFVPIKVLGWLHWSLTERGLTAALINISGWEKLFQWHFWIGNQALFETGEIIRIEE